MCRDLEAVQAENDRLVRAFVDVDAKVQAEKDAIVAVASKVALRAKDAEDKLEDAFRRAYALESAAEISRQAHASFRKKAASERAQMFKELEAERAVSSALKLKVDALQADNAALRRDALVLDARIREFGEEYTTVVLVVHTAEALRDYVGKVASELRGADTAAELARRAFSWLRRYDAGKDMEPYVDEVVNAREGAWRAAAAKRLDTLWKPAC